MKSLLLTTFLFSFVSGMAIENPDAVIGVWKNSSGKGHVQIYKQEGKYYGKIIWLLNDKDEKGQPKVDRKNSDPAQRSKPLIGLVMMRDFEYKNGEWANGYIYNPSDGNEYKAYLKMQDNSTLTVRGYVGFSWFGKTDIWTRVQ